MALICLLILLMAFGCFGQVSRLHRYSEAQNIVTLVPTIPMKFNDGNSDTIYVNISADSMGVGDYDVRVFMFMPDSRDVGGYVIQLYFEDGGHIFLEQSMYIPKYNYAEYDVSAKDYEQLSCKKFDVISFNKDMLMEPCTNIKTKDFFVKFCNSLK